MKTAFEENWYRVLTDEILLNCSRSNRRKMIGTVTGHCKLKVGSATCRRYYEGDKTSYSKEILCLGTPRNFSSSTTSFRRRIDFKPIRPTLQWTNIVHWHHGNIESKVTYKPKIWQTFAPKAATSFSVFKFNLLAASFNEILSYELSRQAAISPRTVSNSMSMKTL